MNTNTDTNNYDVIIVGGGWGGIFTLKYCLEENLKVMLLEKNNELGGVWNINNSPSVYANTYSVTSKYYLSISDFPIPEDYPEFPHHSLVYEYMKNYVQHFQLEKYISLRSDVIKIYKQNQDTQWNIIYKKGAEVIHLNAKNIALCTGQNSRCINMPNIDYSRFKGTLIHASKFDETFRNEYCLNKRVLVYGGSDTASDIADELTNNMYSNYGKSNGHADYGYSAPDDTVSNRKTVVYMSMHKGRWFQRRNIGTNAADMLYNRTLDNSLKTIGKSSINGTFVKEVEFWWGSGGSEIKEWQPKAGYLNSYYVKSSNIINKVTIGEIIPKANIVEIKENSVVFESVGEENQSKNQPTNEVEIDTIIFATGYKGMSCFYEIPDYIKNGKYYEHLFLIDDPSVVTIGFIRPYLTSIPMIIEMQSRYVSQVFANKIKLPSKTFMEYEYESMRAKQAIEFSYDYERVQGIIDPYDYMNLIGTKIGAMPNLFSILVENPQLFYLCLFGSWSHYYFTLNDKNPDKRKIAREQILMLKDNPTSQRVSSRVKSVVSYLLLDYTFELSFYMLIILLVIIFAYYFLNSKSKSNSNSKSFLYKLRNK
jgi:dimethylaniline monooxygenase (N-oxide forming)